MVELLQVGAILSTHGLKGEVKVFPTTDDKQRFLELNECIWEKGTKRENLTIQSCRFFKSLVILKFRGIDDINAVEPYVKGNLFVDRDHAVACEEGEYFIADLIGLSVVEDTGRDLGYLTDVIETGANDVYVVEKDGREILIPAIRQCILDVDLAGSVMTVHLLDGLGE